MVPPPLNAGAINVTDAVYRLVDALAPTTVAVPIIGAPGAAAVVVNVILPEAVHV